MTKFSKDVVMENVFRKPLLLSVCILKDIKLPMEQVKPLLPTLNCALVNPRLVYSFDQLGAALMRVHSNRISNSMRTRSPYTELLLALSPSTNVTESLRIFGLDGSDCNDAIAVRLDCQDGNSFAGELADTLKCNVAEYKSDELFQELCNFEQIRTLYKLRCSDPSLTARVSGELCTIIATKSV